MRTPAGPAPTPLSIRTTVGAEDYPALVDIWSSSVLATHDFLAPADREAIRAKLATDYFPAVDLSVAERARQPVGFCGVLDGNLEMLFVHAEHRGAGVGSLLLQHAVSDRGVRAVDVNEQNRLALTFYTRRGFHVVGRSQTDAAGLPYPLLHLALR